MQMLSQVMKPQPIGPMTVTSIHSMEKNIFGALFCKSSMRSSLVSSILMDKVYNTKESNWKEIRLLLTN